MKPPGVNRRRPAGAENQPVGSGEAPSGDAGFTPRTTGAPRELSEWHEGSKGDVRTNYRLHNINQ